MKIFVSRIFFKNFEVLFRKFCIESLGFRPTFLKVGIDFVLRINGYFLNNQKFLSLQHFFTMSLYIDSNLEKCAIFSFRPFLRHFGMNFEMEHVIMGLFLGLLY